MTRQKVLVTGATGYIGGRLIPYLLDAGYTVRCLTRNGPKLDGLPWRDRVEVVEADLLDAATLDGIVDDCDVAFYLVHSMDQSAEDFGKRDRTAARNFSAAADRADLGRIVYLGGLGDGDLSPHLASRQEVGSILASKSTPVTELRAAVIIGSGSVSFEMLRYLTEVLPVMVTPKWVRTLCQPIAIRDVLEILMAAMEDDGPSVIREIGGPDQLSYQEMMQVYAQAAGLRRRLIVPVPALTPRLSSLWIGLVTPLPTGVAKPLVDSLTVQVTVEDNSYSQRVASPMSRYREAVIRALQRASAMEVPTRWSGAGSAPALPYPGDPEWSGGTVERDKQEVVADASASDVFWACCRIGGDVGYYTMNWAWRLRGALDSLVGGVGLRRGRRHPEQLRLGEAVDFWRVVGLVPDKTISLHAEMRLPGEAWLEFEVAQTTSGTRLTQTALFRPRGLAGRIYWWAMFPFHTVIFRRMADGIARAAEGRIRPSPGCR